MQFLSTQTQSIINLLDKMKKEILSTSEVNLKVSSYSYQPCHFISCASQSAHALPYFGFSSGSEHEYQCTSAGLKSSTFEFLLTS